MKNILIISAIVIGLASFVWGAKLIHYNYAHERDVTYMLKSGGESVSDEIAASHSDQAVKDLIVHLGLIVIGVVLIVVPLVVKLKAHNKSLKHGTAQSAAP
jgi:multisubunit Na+/H+ antiporter MnhC subunit